MMTKAEELGGTPTTVHRISAPIVDLSATLTLHNGVSTTVLRIQKGELNSLQTHLLAQAL